MYIQTTSFSLSSCQGVRYILGVGLRLGPERFDANQSWAAAETRTLQRELSQSTMVAGRELARTLELPSETLQEPSFQI